MATIREIAEKYCPGHNAINDEKGSEEGFFHCQQCAAIIRARFDAALRELGEELAKICEANPRQTASVCAERIRAAIGER